MAGQTVATAYVALLPSFRGGASAIGREMDGPLATAGATGGTKYGGGMKTSIARMAKSVFAPLLAIGATVMVGKFFSGAIEEASGLNESINALNVSYGGASEGVQALGKSAAQNLGLSNLEFNNLAVRFSSFSKTIAGDGGDVTKTLADLTGRASDFASVMNIDVNEAAQLFQSGLAGESEPLRKYGIDMSAASVQAYAYANGIGATGTALTEAQKIQARSGLLMEQTSKTQGDFANTSDQLANKQRIVAARFADVKARIGTALLPAMSALVGFVGDRLLPAFDSVGSFITGTVVPAIKGFVAEFQNGEGAAGPFRDILETIGDVLSNVGSFITGTVVPAFQQFAGFVQANVIPAIQQMATFFSENILPAIQSVAGFVMDTLVPAIMSFWSTVVENVIPVAQALWKQFTTNILPALESVWAIIQEKVIPVLIQLGEFLTPIISFIYEWAVKIGGFLIPILVNFIGPILGGLITVLGTVIGWVFSAIGGIISFAGAIGTGITKVVEFASTVGTKINEVVGWFTGLPGKIGTAVSGIWDGLWTSFKGALNNIIRAWNNFSITMGGGTTPWGAEWPSFTLNTPNIPYLAEGALVTNPALAMLGESGSEAVLPFSRVDEFAAMVARQMGQMDLGPVSGRGITIEQHIHPTPGMSEDQVGAMAGRAAERALIGVLG